MHRGNAIVPAFVAGAIVLTAVSPAEAAFDECSYDTATATVTASLIASADGRLGVGSAGSIMADDAPCGAATTSNTDAVVVEGSRETDIVTIDNSGPGGRFTEPGTDDEIEFDVDLGEFNECITGSGCVDQPQVLRVIGTRGSDEIRAGTDGPDAGWRPACRRRPHIAAITGEYEPPGQVLVNLDAGSDLDPDIDARNASLEVEGGEGDDALIALGGSGAGAHPLPLVLRGGRGDDVLVAGAHNSHIYPGAGDDTVVPSPSGHDVVTYANAPAGVSADVSAGEVEADGFGGSDEIHGVFCMHGSDHADRFAASYERVTISAGGGPDLIVGSDRADALDGGPGDDRIDAAPDDGFSYGDFITGGPGRDVLRGGAGADRLSGGPGDDVLNARRSAGPPPGIPPFEADTRDRLDGGPGSDLLAGGRDAHAYVFGRPVGDETDTIVEGPRRGRDTVEFVYEDLGFVDLPDIPVEIDLSSRGRRFAVSGTRTIKTPVRGGARELENVTVWGLGEDRIVGNGARNVIRPGGGPDSVDCRGGRDRVEGDLEDPEDTLTGCEIVKPFD